MRDKFSKSNINTVSGNVFNGPTNIVSGNNTDFNGVHRERLLHIRLNLFGEAL